MWESWERAEATARHLYPVWSVMIARELRELLAVAPDGRIRSRLCAPVEHALMEGTTQAAPDFTRIVVPALSIYAYPTNFDRLWEEMDAASHAAVQHWTDEVFLPYVRESTERFRREVPLGRVVELPGAHHYCFLDQRDTVYQEMRTFLIPAR